MSYYFSTELDMPFDKAITLVTEELKKEGFGVLTDIDVRATLKKKLGAEFRNYRILGTCNPPFAHKALLAEDKIGIMLPCNVVVRQVEGGTRVEVVNTDAMVQIFPDSGELKNVADEVGKRLERVLKAV